MLDKTSGMLNDNGIILYMVCSFLKNETTDQVENFLLKNNNFILFNFFKNEKNNQIKKYIKEKVMLTLPNKFNKFNVDGYFAAYLKKYR